MVGEDRLLVDSSRSGEAFEEASTPVQLLCTGVRIREEDLCSDSPFRFGPSIRERERERKRHILIVRDENRRFFIFKREEF